MKKLLLFGATAMIAAGAMAQEADAPVNYTAQPNVLVGALIDHLSPNGVWAGSQQFGSLVIANLVEGSFDVFEHDYEAGLEYYLGNGNAVSNNGVFVGTEYATGAPEYYEDGEWIILPTKEADSNQLECLSNGVSADGNLIVGTAGRSAMETDEDSQMAFPVLWQRNEDGKFNMYIDLPAPAKDLMGKVPQRVTAINISDDGKTIAGQIIDNSGMMIQPIIFVQNEEGEWSYKLPCDKLYHPDVVLPPDPGEAPVAPYAKDYMTAEEYEQYQQDVNDYLSGKITDYPEVGDYMTDEKAAEYQAAKDAYDVVYAKWEEESYAYYDALDVYMNDMPLLTMNASCLSSNGRYLLTSISKGNFWEAKYYPVLIDLQEDTMVISENDGIGTFVNDEGVVLAASSISGQARAAWVSEDMLKTATPLQDYVKGLNEEVYNFMNENMRHDYESYDPETFDPIVIEGAWFTGTPVATADMSMIITWCPNVWNFEDDAPYSYSYVLPLSKEDGIRNINNTVSTLSVRGEGHGVVAINGQANRLEVYDAQGRLVFRQNTPESRVATNLPAGIYMLKVYNAQGKSASAKAAL